MKGNYVQKSSIARIICTHKIIWMKKICQKALKTGQRFEGGNENVPKSLNEEKMIARKSLHEGKI